jgi:hypothetical protein
MPTGIYERKPQPYPDPMIRFWKKVKKTDTCWIWQDKLDKDGYGKIWIRGRNERAHRFIYEQTYGPLPPDHFACHTCDVPYCVNPEHLFAGTQLDNVHDAIAKGRWNYEKRDSAKYTRGAANKMTKLTEEQVREIRRVYKPRRPGRRAQSEINENPTFVELAQRYGVTKGAISGAVKGLTWKQVT